MSNFISNIKKHKKLAVICAAVLAAAVAAAVLASVLAKQKKGPEPESHKRTLYFEDTDYPVYVTNQGDKLLIELDGSATPELNWTSDLEPYGIARIEPEKDEKNGKYSLSLEPFQSGFAAASFRRSSEIAGLNYDVVTIYADFYISENKEGEMIMTLSDMRQIGSSAGAPDTDTPYLINGSRIYMPNGGDWVLKAEDAQGIPDDHFNSYRNIDENNYEYIEFFYANSAEDPEKPETGASETVLYLESAALGIRQRLEYSLNDNNEWVLCAAEDTDEE